MNFFHVYFPDGKLLRTLNLTTLELFVLVCDTGSLSGAADRANIVSSSVSKRLALLEEQIGGQLLARKRHGMVPTGAGLALLEHARGVLDRANRLQRDMQAYVAGGQQQVRVLASSSALTQSLAVDIAAFLRTPASGKIHVDLEEGRSTPWVIHGVQEGLASIGVCWVDGVIEGLESSPYRGDELCVVAPIRHPLAERSKVTFEETLEFEHVSLPASTSLHVMLQRLAGQAGRLLRHRIVVYSFDAALRVISAGLAIGVLPRPVAEANAANLKLRVVTLDEDWARREFVLCIRDRRSLTPAAQLLLDHLVAAARV